MTRVGRLVLVRSIVVVILTVQYVTVHIHSICFFRIMFWLKLKSLQFFILQKPKASQRHQGLDLLGVAMVDSIEAKSELIDGTEIALFDVGFLNTSCDDSMLCYWYGLWYKTYSFDLWFGSYICVLKVWRVTDCWRFGGPQRLLRLCQRRLKPPPPTQTPGRHAASLEG